MTETTDWNSGQGAYPGDRDSWTLRMENLPPAGVVPPDDIGGCRYELSEVTRHLSTRPTLDEILSLCTDEMGDVEREVRVAWSLTDVTGEQIDDGKFAINPTGGAA